MSRAARNQFEKDQSNVQGLQGQLGTAATNINNQAQQIQPLSPADKAAYTAQNTSGTATAFGEGMQRAKNLAARTGSQAGLQEVNANLTRGQAAQNARNTQSAQQYFHNDQNQTAQEKASVFSMGAQPVESALGSATQQQGQVAQQAFAPGIWEQTLAGIAGNAGKTLTS